MELRLPTVTELGNGRASKGGEPKSPSDELIRVARPGRNKTTAYERYLAYNKLPRKKNARKRLGERIEEEWGDIKSDKKAMKERRNRL